MQTPGVASAILFQGREITELSGSLLSTVTQIMDRGQNTNSYKFALLRSLAAFGIQHGNGEEVISREWLAERFIEFYWPITVRFQIRQATVLDKDPVVMKFIRNETNELGLPPEMPLRRYRDQHSDRYGELVARTAGNAFDDVIPRFHTVARRKIKPRLYKIDGEDIIIGKKQRMFLRENHKTLDLLAVGAWVKFTESFTSAPRLYEKIQGLEPTRSTLTRYRNFLLSWGEPSCFYCSEPVRNNSDVDHVVPWSFIAEDKIWNLVLACDQCNGDKLSATPADMFINKLNERNHQLLEVGDDNILDAKIRKELAEWRGRDLAEHIWMLVNRCRADGFGTWGP